jgi:hypothetical protein
MPVLSASTVQVLPVSTRTATSLEDLQAALAAKPPRLEGHVPGWASSDDHESNLGGFNVAPPRTDPLLLPASDMMPATLQARYYFWGSPPTAVRNMIGVEAERMRRLEAVDLLISEAGHERFSILLSSRNRQLVNSLDGPLKSLQQVLQESDASIRIDPRHSLVALDSADIFLWLAARSEGNPQLDPNTRLDEVLAISGTDSAYRPSELRAGVDFERPNFLTAVAESDTLGPISIAVIDDKGGRRSSFSFDLHLDGGFQLRKNDVYFPDEMPVEVMMVRASHHLAFDLMARRAHGDHLESHGRSLGSVHVGAQSAQSPTERRPDIDRGLKHSNNDTVDSPAVIRVMSTQPGTSPRSSASPSRAFDSSVLIAPPSLARSLEPRRGSAGKLSTGQRQRPARRGGGDHDRHATATREAACVPPPASALPLNAGW